jgi:PAS domain S-box-containing protein
MGEPPATGAAFHDRDETYRVLFELESDAIFLIDNEAGQILEVNPAASTLYGYSRAELLSKRNVDLSAEPGDTRAATQGQRPRVPFRYHRKKDGTVFPVEITARHFVWRGRDAHIAAIRDITHRQRAEAALVRRTRQLETVRAITAEITRELDLTALLQLIARRVAEIVDASHSLVFLWDEGAGVLRLLEAGHFKGVADVRLRINFFEELSARASAAAAPAVRTEAAGLIDTMNSRIGELVMVAGLTGINRDVPPFCTVVGDRPRSLAGLNKVGLKRAGVAVESVRALKAAFRTLFRTDGPLAERILAVERGTPEVERLLAFVQSSKRGVIGLAGVAEEADDD